MVATPPYHPFTSSKPSLTAKKSRQNKYVMSERKFNSSGAAKKKILEESKVKKKKKKKGKKGN